MPSKRERLPPDSTTILERSKGVFFSRWEDLLRLRRAVRKTSDLNDIHDLRVSTRRFMAALELLYPFAQKKSKAELRKSVRNLTRILGGLRNVDEAELFFKARASAETTTVSTLSLALSELRSKELKRIEKGLKTFDQRKLDRFVREMVAGLNEECITERNRFSLLAYFSDFSIRMYLPIHQLLTVSTEPGNRSSRHALRISIKKWRYFFEIIAQILDRDYIQVLELLKEYQSILGSMNDIAQFELLLSKLDLPPVFREVAKSTLMEEDALLLKTFSELIERKPLSYTFLL
jgi:CHAD domain-containing protein